LNLILKTSDDKYSFNYTVAEDDGTVVDLTGATTKFRMGNQSKIIFTNPSTVVDAINGVVSYSFAKEDTMYDGSFIGEFEITFPNGSVLSYPRSGYLAVFIQRSVDSNLPNITLEDIAAKQGDYDAKLNSILQQAGNITMSAMNENSWVATAGQLTYVLPSNASVDIANKWVQVFVGGSLIDPSLVKINVPNQITLSIPSSTIVAGMNVYARWTEPIIPVTNGHHATHEQGGQDEIDITKLRNYLPLSDFAISVKSYGAVGNGTTDDSDAIIAAENAVVALGGNATLLIPNGTYKITKNIRIRCNLNASQATINYFGTGTAITIGDESAPATVTSRRIYHLPRVINMSRTTGWDGTSIGIKAVNLNGCHVFVTLIQDFEKGLNVYGYSQGNAYNNYYLGTLWENHKNIVLDGDATGWVNQNQFFGGRLQQTLSKGATLDDTNANHLDMSSTIQPNNNTFIGTSFEGDNIAYYRIDISGRYNAFYNCRYEAQNGSTPRIHYRSTANNNKIDGGYDLVKVVEVFDAGATGGDLRDNAGAQLYATATSGQSIPSSTITIINSWNTPVSRRIAYDPVTGFFTPRAGRWKISATVCFAPNATGRRIAYLVCNGTARDTFETPGNALRGSMKVEDVYAFNGTQTFYVQVQQTSGAALALETTSGYVKIQAEYLGN
jgi:hypothetical protein